MLPREKIINIHQSRQQLTITRGEQGDTHYITCGTSELTKTWKPVSFLVRPETMVASIPPTITYNIPPSSSTFDQFQILKLTSFCLLIVYSERTMFVFIFLMTECLFLIKVRPRCSDKLIWLQYFSPREL